MKTITKNSNRRSPDIYFLTVSFARGSGKHYAYAASAAGRKGRGRLGTTRLGRRKKEEERRKEGKKKKEKRERRKKKRREEKRKKRKEELEGRGGEAFTISVIF